jgi:hypothetical protein
MALTRQKRVFIDFTKEPQTCQRAQTTYAVPTAAANQVDFCLVGGQHYMEWIQNGASTALFWAPKVATPFGWTMPLDGTTADGMEATMGMAATSSAGTVSFTVGTDAAFFARVKGVISTINTMRTLMIGFRELAAYVDIDASADALAAYDNKAIVGVVDTAAAVNSYFTRGAGNDVATVATGTPIVAGTSFEFMVRVSATGAVTYYIALDADTTPLGTSPTADVLLAAPAQVITDATVLVPCIIGVGADATTPDFVLQEWEVGYQ